MRSMCHFNIWCRITPVTQKSRRSWAKALRWQWILTPQRVRRLGPVLYSVPENYCVNFGQTSPFHSSDTPSSLFFFFLSYLDFKVQRQKHMPTRGSSSVYILIYRFKTRRKISVWRPPVGFCPHGPLQSMISGQLCWMRRASVLAQKSPEFLEHLQKRVLRCTFAHVAFMTWYVFWSALLLGKSWSCFLMMGTPLFPLSMHRVLSHLLVLCVGNSDCCYISSFTNVTKYQAILFPKSNLIFLLRFLLI